MASSPRVALFVTCLVDLHRPSIGFAALKLLKRAGCTVEVPRAQTCCGQPAYNAGDRATARVLAMSILDAFGGYDFIVAPSGSCAAMIRHHLPALIENDPNLSAKARQLGEKTYELISFLTDVMGVKSVSARLDETVTYHDSCSGLRELGVHDQPRALLSTVQGLKIKEMADPDVCCGFGGTFCVKYPEVSARMALDKIEDIAATGATTVLAGDLGCLLNIAGRASREQVPVKVRHIAEILADMATEIPPIGAARPD